MSRLHTKPISINSGSFSIPSARRKAAPSLSLKSTKPANLTLTHCRRGSCFANESQKTPKPAVSAKPVFRFPIKNESSRPGKDKLGYKKPPNRKSMFSVSSHTTATSPGDHNKKPHLTIQIDTDNELVQEVINEPSINIVKETLPFHSISSSRNTSVKPTQRNRCNSINEPLTSVRTMVEKNSDGRRFSFAGDLQFNSLQTPRETTKSNATYSNLMLDWLPEYSFVDVNKDTSDYEKNYTELKGHMNKLYKENDSETNLKEDAKVKQTKYWKKDLLGYVNPLGNVIAKMSGYYIERKQKPVPELINACFIACSILWKISMDEYQKAATNPEISTEKIGRILRINELTTFRNSPAAALSKTSFFNFPLYLL